MTMTVNGQVEQRTAPHIAAIQGSLQGMTVRVNASHAHRNSLDRAAQGLRSIHGRLMLVLEERVTRSGWTAENRLARSALEAMDEQLRLALTGDGALPVEEQRDHLRHALFRAGDALVLLEA
jgi:hypothetical protein